jgi:hypothetical protein
VQEDWLPGSASFDTPPENRSDPPAQPKENQMSETTGPSPEWMLNIQSRIAAQEILTLHITARLAAQFERPELTVVSLFDEIDRDIRASATGSPDLLEAVHRQLGSLRAAVFSLLQLPDEPAG